MAETVTVVPNKYQAPASAWPKGDTHSLAHVIRTGVYIMTINSRDTSPVMG